ncbi:MAG: aldo/keto reductase [Gammaproteobacteria bacterium]|nr:aldo/keto reductase [Gammaproteobacteria bacterium]
MHTIELGTQGLEVSAIGLGCMPMSQGYGATDEKESERTLKQALDVGVNFLDTADAYGWGHNEKLVGKVLATERDRIVLGTKFAVRRTDTGSEICGRPEYVRAACDASLKRLGYETIDLYYMHRLDPDVPIEESVGAMADLVSAGKVRYLGLSEVSAATLRRAHAEHPISAVQSEYSLWTRDPEEHVLPACRELGVGFVPFSPLGRAILTGNIDSGDTFEKGDSRARMPRFQGENFARNIAVIERFKDYAKGLECTPAQLALAWLLAQGEDIAPIPGTKRPGYVKQNAASTEVVLSPEQLATVDEMVSPDSIAGARYDDASLALVDQDAD